ncbi:hypothetical protein IFR05_000375 [Cadophora sp. M221]|nr:hypothetical protein IFR05_000375 [Cadophora sp. M221]
MPTIFDDNLRYNSTTHEFCRDLDPQQPQYFGLPSPEIDSAWVELLHGEFLGISDEEARENPDLDFNEEDRVSETGHFHIAIDVFHSLHCLNAIRKELDHEYYIPPDGDVEKATGKHHDHSLWSEKSRRVHLDHCMNHIRQSLQCHPDLSLAAMKKQVSGSGQTIYLGNAEKHTCQDWGSIRKWVDARVESGLGYWDE